MYHTPESIEQIQNSITTQNNAELAAATILMTSKFKFTGTNIMFRQEVFPQNMLVSPVKKKNSTS